MAIFAMADLHLAISNPEKSMEEFGEGWRDYITRIKTNWEETVTDEDTVLMPGDLSWAMYIDKANEDLQFIDSLPGTKLFSRGNHDYWWTTVSKMEKYCADQGFNTIRFVRNNVIEVEDSLITGTRGWKLPSDSGFDAEDRRIYERETLRLGLCLKQLQAADPDHGRRHIVMLHYPPLTQKSPSSAFTGLLEEAGVDLCIYGHLHGFAHAGAFEGSITPGKGTIYRCVASDFLGFKPLRL